jgi:hypothetical protein
VLWMIGRLTARYSPAPGSDRVLIEPRLRHRTPSARMIFAHTLVIAEGGSNNFALGGRCHRVSNTQGLLEPCHALTL